MKNARILSLIAFLTQALALVSLAAPAPKPAPVPFRLSAQERVELLDVQANVHTIEAEDVQEKASLAAAHDDNQKAQAGEATAKAEAAKLGSIAATAEADRVAAVKALAVADKAKWHARELLVVVILAGLISIASIGAELQVLLRAEVSAVGNLALTAIKAARLGLKAAFPTVLFWL